MVNKNKLNNVPKSIKTRLGYFIVPDSPIAASTEPEKPKDPNAKTAPTDSTDIYKALDEICEELGLVGKESINRLNITNYYEYRYTVKLDQSLFDRYLSYWLVYGKKWVNDDDDADDWEKQYAMYGY